MCACVSFQCSRGIIDAKGKRWLWVYFLPRDCSNMRYFPLKSVHGHSGHKVRYGVTTVHVLDWLLQQLETPTDPDSFWQPTGR